MSDNVLSIDVSKDGWTGLLQLSIGDYNGGYRIHGPKFNGSTKILIRHQINERDAMEIRTLLDKYFPSKPTEPKRRKKRV